MKDSEITIKDRQFIPFINDKQIAAAIKNVAAKINTDLAGECPVFVSVLNGSFMFTADLLREISIPCELAFIRLASYQGTASTGEVTQLMGLNENVAGRTVVVLEDVVDTGLTLHTLRQTLQRLKAGRVLVAAVLVKEPAIANNCHVDYAGFTIPDKFVVGYGMDYLGFGRNLPEILVLA